MPVLTFFFMAMKKYLPLFISLLLIYGCTQSVQETTKQLDKSPELSSQTISEVINQMTDLMVHDVTNPPLASRFFSYVCLSGYEVIAQEHAVQQPVFQKS